MFQDCHVLSGKIRKTIDIKRMIFRKGTILQLLKQPGHLISGISFTAGAQAVISFHDQSQFFQFLGNTAFQGVTGFS